MIPPTSLFFFHQKAIGIVQFIEIQKCVQIMVRVAARGQSPFGPETRAYLMIDLPLPDCGEV